MNLFSENKVKNALNSNEFVIGPSITAANADVALTLANCGFDFLWIEMEHSPVTLESARSMIMATKNLVVPFIRVPINELWLAKRALDIGCYGVIFPFVSTKIQAEQAVNACKYLPDGLRGYGPAMAASLWGKDQIEGYREWANSNIMVIVIIETNDAIKNIEDIASVKGIDVLFIGTNDLSLCVCGKIHNQSLEEFNALESAKAKVLASGRKNNIIVGCPVTEASQIRDLRNEGYRFFQVPNDLTLLEKGASDFIRDCRKTPVSV